MTDTEIRINQRVYRVIVYECAEHGGYRAEAGYQGRVVVVIDTPNEAAAWRGIRAKLEARRWNTKL